MQNESKHKNPVREPGREPGQAVKGTGRSECVCGCPKKNAAANATEVNTEVNG